MHNADTQNADYCFQRIERILYSALQYSQPDLHDLKSEQLGQIENFTEDLLQQNLLLHGDNLHVLEVLAGGLLQKTFSGHQGVKLIYLDPPFAVGSDFSIPILAGSKKTAFRGIPALAYSDTWPQEEDFYTMLFDRLTRMRDLLDEDGSIYVHCDWRTHARIRLFMDRLFGKNRFLSEIVWHYTGGGRSNRYFSRKHDLILHYAKSKNWIFNTDAVRVPFKEGSGYAKGGIISAAGKRYTPNPLGTPIDDVWDIPIINPLSNERLGYPTQKPEALLERIIAASSNVGDIVMDPFCGSGTTAAVAERLGRRWIAADASPFAVQTAYKRLAALRLNRMQSAPFEDIAANHSTGFDFLHLKSSEANHKNNDMAYCSAEILSGTLLYSAPEITVNIQRTEQNFQIKISRLSVAELHIEGAAKYKKNMQLSLKDSIVFWQDQPLMQDSLEWIDSWSIGLYVRPKSTCNAADLECILSYPIAKENMSDRKQKIMSAAPDTRQTYASPWLPLKALKDSSAAKPHSLQWAVRAVDIFAKEHYILFTP